MYNLKMEKASNDGSGWCIGDRLLKRGDWIFCQKTENSDRFIGKYTEHGKLDECTYDPEVLENDIGGGAITLKEDLLVHCRIKE